MAVVYVLCVCVCVCVCVAVVSASHLRTIVHACICEHTQHIHIHFSISMHTHAQTHTHMHSRTHRRTRAHFILVAHLTQLPKVSKLPPDYFICSSVGHFYSPICSQMLVISVYSGVWLASPSFLRTCSCCTSIQVVSGRMEMPHVAWSIQLAPVSNASLTLCASLLLHNRI